MFAIHPISGVAFLAAYGLALALSALFCRLTIRLLGGPGPLARFVRERVPAKPGAVPFGGVAVVLSFLIVIWIIIAFENLPSTHLKLFGTVSLGVALMFLLGIYDDLVVATPWTKLLGQGVIALGLYFAGFQIERIGDWWEFGPLAPVVTLLWIVGISNSLNLIDGQDGLAGSIVFLSCLTLTFVYLGRQMFEAPFIAVVLAGSIFGFLLFNWPPAKIILGDTGSLPLGLLMALVTLLPLSQGYTDEIFYLIPVVTLLVPITDTTWAFFRRLAKGVSPFSRDQEHFHHRLERLGLSPTQSIFVLLGIAIYFDLWSLLPVYKIDLIPNFIPVFFLGILIHLAGLSFWLWYLERNNPPGVQ